MTNEGLPKLGIHDIIRQLYQPLKIAPSEPSFSFLGDDLNLT